MYQHLTKLTANAISTSACCKIIAQKNSNLVKQDLILHRHFYEINVLKPLFLLALSIFISILCWGCALCLVLGQFFRHIQRKLVSTNPLPQG